MTSSNPSVDRIDQLAFGFIASKVLLSAIELGLFTELAKGPLDVEEIRRRLALHPRGVRDFLDALVALSVLERKEGNYMNTAESDFYLDRAKPTYVGVLYEMMGARVYGFVGSLTDGLRTGKPQNEIKAGENLFEAIYADQNKLRAFLRAMTGHSLPSAMAMAHRFPWMKYKTFADVGTAQGCLPVQVALANPHVLGLGFDLPAVRPLFEEYVSSFGLKDRLQFRGGNFFEDPLPEADVIVMGMILHDWSLDDRRKLLRKAYDALPDGGSLIVYERLIDDERGRNVAGFLESLLMLIETQEGSDYTGADCSTWMRETGFKETRVEPLTGVESMIVGIK